MKNSILFVILFIFLSIENDYSQQYINDFDSYVIKSKTRIQPNLLNSFESKTLIKVQPKYFQAINSFNKQSKDKQLSNNQNIELSALNKYSVIYIPKNQNKDSILNILKSDIGIDLIEPNHIFHIEQFKKPNDPLYPQQWGLQTVGAEKAWQKATGKDIIIGVVDTGIDTSHIDLKNNFWVNPGEDLNHNGKFDPWPDTVQINGVYGDLNGRDNDGNGYVDDVIGYNFVNQYVTNLGTSSSFSPFPNDEMGHGTNVSGVIAATRDNNIGITGLAYNAKIMVLRAFDLNGNAQSDNIASAIVYGALNGAKVINMSFGDLFSSSIVEDAVKFAQSMGCIMVASAGNDGNNESHYPSDYNGVISVGWTDNQNQRNYSSNYGPKLTLMAPGVNILTTSFDGNYKQASGSSLSAPFVSASAALLLEINPNLKASDISGILQSTALQVGNKKGWNQFYGAGILQIGEAVNYTGSSDIELTNPVNDAVFNRSKISNINLIGTITNPLFDNYLILLGMGANPTAWDTLFADSQQVVGDTIKNLDISKLTDTTYTISLFVNLRNLNIMQANTRINIISDSTPLKIVSNKIIPAYYNGKRVITINVVTNKISLLKVRYTKPGSTFQYYEKTDNGLKSYYHTIVIDDFVEPGLQYNALAIADIDGNDDTLAFNFTNKNDIFPSDNFIKKPYNTNWSYIFNKTADFYGDGKDSYIANDLSGGYWDSTKVFEFDNNQLNQKYSMTDIKIPVGYGDSNGDGINEVFTKIYNSSILYQAASKGASPFSSVLFEDSLSGNLTAAGMFDFDKDGREDLVAYSDTAFHVFSYKNGKYIQLAMAVLDTNQRKLGEITGSVIGDFDGDGKDELCVGNSSGNIFIFKFDNGKFNFVFEDSIKTGNSAMYITKADIDGDGIPEIVVGNNGTTTLFNVEGAGEPIWQFRIYKSDKINHYNIIWKENFYGVQDGSTHSGIFYRNGVAAGDLDGIKGEEVVISPFPNLYVFKYDTSLHTMVPFWWYPYCFTNSALIHDFDKNGINEIGFNTYNDGQLTEFFEYKANYKCPRATTKLEGWALNDSTVFLKWNQAQDALTYIINYGKIEGNSILFDSLASTPNDSITLTGLIPNSDYYFLMYSYNPSFQNATSDTTLIQIHLHQPAAPIIVMVKNQEELIIPFTSKLTDIPPDIGNFEVIADSISYFPRTVNRINDTCLNITFNSQLPVGNVQILVKSFRDYYQSPTISRSFDLTIPINKIQEQEMYLIKLDLITNHELQLFYSEAVNYTTAAILSNYILKPTGTISGVKPGTNENDVLITLDPSSVIGALGMNYTITSQNVDAKSGRNITKGSGNTLGFTLSANQLDNVFVYPNPINLNEKPVIMFANLTPLAIVTIYNLDRNVIKTLTETNGNGGVEWDGTDSNGNLLNSGTYLYKVTGTNKDGISMESGLKKFLIIK